MNTTLKAISYLGFLRSACGRLIRAIPTLTLRAAAPSNSDSREIVFPCEAHVCLDTLRSARNSHRACVPDLP